MDPEITPEVVDALAKVAGFEVPEEDRVLLAAVLENQLSSVRRLEQLDVGDVEPIVSFDPRWR
jgi:Asp-tRNA(Asn)/Glu-tRNA(Gln) amidotransferase C subunit